MRRPQRPDSLLPSRGSSHGRLSTWLPLPQRTAAGRPLAVGGGEGSMRPVSPQVTPYCAWRTQSPAWVPAQAQTAPCPPTHTPQSNLGSTCPAWGGNSASQRFKFLC